MTFTDMQTEAADLAELGGFTNTADAPNWADLVNKAYASLCWDADAIHGPETTFNSVIGQAEYILPSPEWKTVLDLLYNGIRLERSSEVVVRRESPEWLTTANNIPYRYWVPRSDTVRLYPVPNAIQTVTVYGVRAPAALVNGTDVPNVPSQWQRAIPARAAWRHLKKYARGEERAYVADLLTEYNDAAMGWRNEIAEQEYVNADRYVMEVVPEAIYI